MNLFSHHSLLGLLLLFTMGEAALSAENCSGYLSLLERYQKDRKEFLTCGISANDYFMTVNHDEQAIWCTNATQAEVNQRYNQAGFPTLRCGGTLHRFSLEPNSKSSQHFGLIHALYETVKLEPVSSEILATIIDNPGQKTGAKFSTFPIQDLQGANPTCRLQSVETKLSTDPTRIHWLVSAEPPCQRDEFNQSPFWLIEQQNNQYRVLLAYRTDSLDVQTKRYQGYPKIETYHMLDNGHNDSAEITWQYDPKQGQYRYAASRCSNLSRLDDSEPASFEDCYQGETW